MNIPFKYNDGGREKYFKGSAGDCVTRAIAIAFEMDYKKVYNALGDAQKKWANNSWSKKAKTCREKSSTARDGVYKEVWDPFILDHGGKWEALMGIGTGCQVHVRPDELRSKGTSILRLSGHLSVWKDGVLHDTHNCSRNGTRCVYGRYIIK